MTHNVRNPRKQALFVLLSGMDLALTWWLLEGSGRTVDEANPVARWWLIQFGWAGLALFKVALVLLVAGTTEILARKRPQVARRVLEFGCATLALVVLYSAGLASTGAGDVKSDGTDDGSSLVLEKGQDFETLIGFSVFLDQITLDVQAGRRSLREAADQVARTQRGSSAAWQQQLLDRFPGCSLEQATACFLLFRFVASQRDPGEAWRLADRLEREYFDVFGVSAPLDHRSLLPSFECGPPNVYDDPEGPSADHEAVDVIGF